MNNQLATMSAYLTNDTTKKYLEKYVRQQYKIICNIIINNGW